MKKHIMRPFAASLAVVVLGLSLVGCAGKKDDDKGLAEALPPMIAEVSELEGATFEINARQPLVVNAPDPTEWQGSSEDPSIAEFVPGKEEDTAVYNPAFEGKSAGTTSATMTSPDGTVYNFTIEVQ